ncbi:MAG TPA: ion channel [Steroidobacteraceae bacterium]|nr:ion channel [Steroidobacteraceae bacterium]
MLRNLAVGLPTVLVCMVVQVAFAFWCVRYYVRHPAARRSADDRLLRAIRPILVAVLILLCGALVQISLWATLFLALGEFDEAYEAVYHSAVNLSSLGYGDIVMSKPWKLLGPLEAVCGVLMLGMTAAALMAILQHMINALREDGT